MKNLKKGLSGCLFICPSLVNDPSNVFEQIHFRENCEIDGNEKRANVGDCGPLF